MTRQEEIREWIAKKIYNSIMTLFGDDFPEDYQPDSLFCNTVTDKILTYLHSQGVVIKVDMPRLPSPYKDGCPENIGFNHAVSILEEARFTVVEPLIE